MKTKTVELDTVKLERFMAERNLTKVEVSRAIGRSESFICMAINKKRMGETAYRFLCECYGLKYNAFLKEEVKEEPKVEEPGWNIAILPDVDRVYLELRKDGRKIKGVYSRLKGDGVLDLMQAISYGAHLMYKFAEQDELGAE